MTSSRSPRAARASLQVENLEDRVTPSFPSYDPHLPLPGQVAAGAIAGDRVTVLLNPGVTGAALGSAPFASSVRSIGFGMYSVRLTPGTDLGRAIAYYGAPPGVTLA